MSSTRTLLKGILAVVAITMSNVSNGGIIETFTDRARFEEKLTGSTLITESFDGSAVLFAPNSTGNLIGAFTTVDLIGGSDKKVVGIRAKKDGFFEGTVDSDGNDALKLNFNIGPAMGFGIIGLQNDSNTNPADLHLQEIGFIIGEERFLISDLLDLTDSSKGEIVEDQDSEGPIPFIGFISTSVFSSFQIVHGDEIVTGGVPGNSEDFLIKSLVVAPAKVPAPGSIALFAIALLGLSASKVRKIAE